MTKPQSQTQVEVPDGPAIVTPFHRQDRELSSVAGSPRGYRRLDGLAWLAEEKKINANQYEAGRRLQDDYAISQRQGGAQSNLGGRIDSSHAWEIPDHAVDASKRVKRALSVLPPQILTMTVMFLIPDFKAKTYSVGRIAKIVNQHPRVITFGVGTALELLARHYG